VRPLQGQLDDHHVIDRVEAMQFSVHVRERVPEDLQHDRQLFRAREDIAKCFVCERAVRRKRVHKSWNVHRFGDGISVSNDLFVFRICSCGVSLCRPSEC
jgi:hypothetical protein